jgi:hypothetical protein
VYNLLCKRSVIQPSSCTAISSLNTDSNWSNVPSVTGKRENAKVASSLFCTLDHSTSAREKQGHWSSSFPLPNRTHIPDRPLTSLGAIVRMCNMIYLFPFPPPPFFFTLDRPQILLLMFWHIQTRDATQILYFKTFFFETNRIADWRCYNQSFIFFPTLTILRMRNYEL